MNENGGKKLIFSITKKIDVFKKYNHGHFELKIRTEV